MSEIRPLELGVFSEAFPAEDVRRILEATGRRGQRQRKLPAYLMVYYVIALGLLASVGAREVLRRLLGRVRDRAPFQGPLASGAAITKARRRLGVEPLRELFKEFVQPIAKKSTYEAWFRKWLVVSLDGGTLATLDTPQNVAAFGRPPASRGKSAWPHMRFVALLENGTRVLFAVATGAYRACEQELARQLLPELKAGMICLADRGFYSHWLWAAAAQTGADLLWRVQKALHLPVIETFADGSYLSSVCADHKRHRKDGPRIAVRVIPFVAVVGSNRTAYRLITTILDPKQAPAIELARLYASRWTIETAFAELKVTLRNRKTVLRSGVPELVEQDFYGLLLAHFGIRSVMADVAREQNVAPSQLSFIHSLSIIVERLPEMFSFSPSGEAALP
jgi:hypothetical protein